MQSTEDMVERLRAAGYKITPARRAVLDVLAQDHAHLNPAEVLERSQAIYPAIGRATVYRTLELLTELGVLRPIYGGDHALSFIDAQGGHHHLVCGECGAMFEFDECMASEIAQSLEERFNFRIQSHLLEFYGQCATCSGNDSPP